MMFLLGRQKDRLWLENRAVLSVYLASVLLGAFMAWLFGNLSVAFPWGAVTALTLLVLVRSMSDAASLNQLLIGGAWREIRLSRLRSSHVVGGILLNGLRHQMTWAFWPAVMVAYACPGYGLVWLGTLALGSVLASLVGQLSVVQRVVSHPRLNGRQSLFLSSGLLTLAGLTTLLDWGMLLVPALLLLAVALLCLADDGLDRIPEGTLIAPEAAVRQRWGRWVPWSENPIVARECARESCRLGRGWLAVLAYFSGWGFVLAAVPVGYLGLTYWAQGEWPVWVRSQGAYYLAAFVLLAGLLQAFRSAQRVFRALGEERDRQTLDLLVVTSLQPDDFVDGWAQVGYTTRQLETALITLVSLFCAYFWGPPLADLALIVYAGLVALGLCVAGAYCGLLLGFRHCARVKRKRDMLFPLALFLWVVMTAPLFYSGWMFLVVQAGAAYLVVQSSRTQALASLGG